MIDLKKYHSLKKVVRSIKKDLSSTEIAIDRQVSKITALADKVATEINKTGRWIPKSYGRFSYNIGATMVSFSCRLYNFPIALLSSTDSEVLSFFKNKFRSYKKNELEKENLRRKKQLERDQARKQRRLATLRKEMERTRNRIEKDLAKTQKKLITINAKVESFKVMNPPKEALSNKDDSNESRIEEPQLRES